MTDVVEFLNQRIPTVLVSAAEYYNFTIVGGRSIAAYTRRYKNSTEDWDLLVVGDDNNALNFVEMLKSALNMMGFNSTMISHSGHGADTDLYNFKSRPWYSITIKTGGVTFTVFDIYTISEVDPTSFIIKDGLSYNDMGYLFRELTRPDEGYDEIIRKSSNITNLQDIIDYTSDNLNKTAINLSVISEEVYELEETLELDDANIVFKEVNKVKDALQKIIEDRDILFGALLGGKINKTTAHTITVLCRNVETEYKEWLELNLKCKQIALVIA